MKKLVIILILITIIFISGCLNYPNPGGLCQDGKEKWSECNKCFCWDDKWSCTEQECGACPGTWVDGQCISENNIEVSDIKDVKENGQIYRILGFVKQGEIMNCDSYQFYLEDDTAKIQIKYENLGIYINKNVEVKGEYKINPSAAICSFNYIAVNSIKLM